jgi:hypothetical protein
VLSAALFSAGGFLIPAARPRPVATPADLPKGERRIGVDPPLTAPPSVVHPQARP